MQSLSVKKIKLGSVFSKPLYLDDGLNEFLPANTPITEDTVELLTNKGIGTVYTDGIGIEQNSQNELSGTGTKGQSPAEGIETDASVKDTQKQKTELNKSVKKTETYVEYTVLVQNVQKIFNAVTKHERLSAKPVSDIVRRLIALLNEHAELCVALILEADLKGFEQAKSAVDVASLSYLIAGYFELPKEKIIEITTAALLHDIGMLRVRSEILQKQDKLTEAEMQLIQTHTVYGYNCLISEFMYPETLARIVMQHHEWYDGSGYPSKLSKDEIDIGARIVACADAFTAMTQKKPYRKALLGYAAMKALLTDNSTHFDPTVINALIRSIGIFPIGSIVMLSDFSICRVVKSVPNFPLRPQLRLLIDENGTEYGDSADKRINLQIQKNLFITQAIDPDDVMG